jgi:phytoene dehydrogenase-like protein
MTKSVIIIGAGIGGLASGCYGQMNGYKTHVFEMHDKPGGLCTAWERKGYTIDGCLHWLSGSAPGSGLYRLWEELGMIQGQKVINSECFFTYESVDGRVFNLFTNVDRLEKHMLEISPEDIIVIKETTKAIRSFMRMDMPVDKAPELYSPLDMIKLTLKILPVMKDFSAYSRITMKEFAERFKNPVLRNAWLNIWLPDFAAVFILITLAQMHMKQAGYVLGGSMKLSHALEKRYLDLGGKINYKARVDKIIVENDKAVGIRLTDGNEIRSDYVISASDGHATIFELLEGKYVDDNIRSYYDTWKIFQPIIYVGLGVNRLFNDEQFPISLLAMELENPQIIGGTEQKLLSVRIHNFDPSMAPEGKTTITSMIESTYDYWSKLNENRTKYKEEKDNISRIVIEQLERRFPGIKEQVEMIDVATPLTFKKYTGNWQGSFEGWQMTPQMVTTSMKKTLPGLEHFYMAGQWVMPGGGIPSGAMTGRYVFQAICKKDGIKFRTSKP